MTTGERARLEEAARGLICAIDRGEVEPAPLELEAFALLLYRAGHYDLAREMEARELVRRGKHGWGSG